jgi:hypothetical protein
VPNEETSTEEKPIEEILDFDKPDFKFVPKETHEWRQKGYYLVCVACELQHAVWIGAEKIMVGTNEKGTPLFKTRKELGMA